MNEDAEERYLIEILARLQEDYAKAAKPYIDRLVAIHIRKPHPPLLVPIEWACDLAKLQMDLGVTGLER